MHYLDIIMNIIEIGRQAYIYSVNNWHYFSNSDYFYWTFQ